MPLAGVPARLRHPSSLQLPRRQTRHAELARCPPLPGFNLTLSAAHLVEAGVPVADVDGELDVAGGLIGSNVNVARCGGLDIVTGGIVDLLMGISRWAGLNNQAW